MSTGSTKTQIDTQPERLPSWKQEINDRLAAHRTRRPRSGSEAQSSLPLDMDEASQAESKAARVAARVAARYAQAPSFEDVLAAARAAEAAAEAAREAQKAADQVHEAAQAMLAGFDQPEVIPQGPSAQTPAMAPAQPPAPPTPRSQGVASSGSAAPVVRQASEPPAATPVEPYDPFEDAVVLPAQLLPAKLLEFPRELIATRKARPRLEEGPLREDATVDSDSARSQLRIFEVEPEVISRDAPGAQAASEWSNLRLDAGPHRQPAVPPRRTHAPTQQETPIEPASLEDRLMAGIVDLCLILVAFLLFVLVFVACTAHPPTGKPAFLGAGIALFGFIFLYQLLFFSFAEGTPGMRYAHIALCTFNDENPDRKAMRNRIGALLLSALPVGLGFAWAFFDDDRLGWHDRISHTYQRSYR